MFHRTLQRAALAGLAALGLAFALSPAPAGAVVPVVAATGPPAAIATQPGAGGYALLDVNGNVYTFGTDYYGGAGKDKVAPFVSMAYTPTGRGYALLDAQGHVYNYGDSKFLGGTPAGATLPFIAIAYQPGSMGYTLVDSRGHIYNFGTDYLDGAHDYTQAYTAFAYTPTGRGYTLLSANGGIYNYGDSRYQGGSPIGATRPFTGLAYRPGTFDYLITDAVGRVFENGTRLLSGPPAGLTPNVVGLATTTSGKGHTIADAVGHIYNFGDSGYHGGFTSIAGPPPISRPTGGLFGDSSGIPCAPGTVDLGTADGWHALKKTRIRLCGLPNLGSTSEESRPGTRFYVAGANGMAIVNARVSGALLAMVNSARNARVAVSARSSYRTHAHQTMLFRNCKLPGCKPGTDVATPGRSNHEMGLAIDFSISAEPTKIADCQHRSTAPDSPLWVWLKANSPAFGFRQFAPEAWHWDPEPGPTRC